MTSGCLGGPGIVGSGMELGHDTLYSNLTSVSGIRNVIRQMRSHMNRRISCNEEAF